MNLLNILNIQNNSNLDLLKAATVKEKLDAFLTPLMNEMGLVNWDENYQWSTDFNQYGVKHIFEYVNLKGISGTFQYGNTFNFIPIINKKGKIVKNHRELQLFERTKGWHESFETLNRITDYRVSHWNEYFFKKSLPIIFNSEKNQIADWFKSNEDIEQNIETALKQIKTGGAYDINSPNQKKILAFLYAKNGDLNLAKSTLYDYYRPLIKLNELFKIEFEEMEKSINEIK